MKETGNYDSERGTRKKKKKKRNIKQAPNTEVLESTGKN